MHTNLCLCTQGKIYLALLNVRDNEHLLIAYQFFFLKKYLNDHANILYYAGIWKLRWLSICEKIDYRNSARVPNLEVKYYNTKMCSKSIDVIAYRHLLQQLKHSNLITISLHKEKKNNMTSSNLLVIHKTMSQIVI